MGGGVVAEFVDRKCGGFSLLPCRFWVGGMVVGLVFGCWAWWVVWWMGLGMVGGMVDGWWAWWVGWWMGGGHGGWGDGWVVGMVGGVVAGWWTWWVG